MRIAALLATVMLLLAAPAAPAQQDGGGAFGPLPPSAPTPVPTVEAPSADDDDVGRLTLYIIGATLLVGFAGLALWITRDARRAVPQGPRPVVATPESEARRHKLERRAKEQTRKRQRAARAARKRNR